MTIANQWMLKLPGNEAVHHIMTFDPNDSNYLYVMTSHHVRVFSCRQDFGLKMSADPPHLCL